LFICWLAFKFKDMSSKIEIPLSKTKTVLPILFLGILGICGISAFLSPESFVTKVSKYDSPESIRTIGIAAAGLSFVLIIVFAKKWFSKKAGLIIDEHGITDISNATYTELVEWKDITGIKKVKNGPIKTIVLMTDKPEKYLDKAKKMSRPTMQKALRFHGSPIVLASSRLKINYDDLVELLSTEFEKANHTSK
jgi:hypothetical protein